MTVCKCAFSEIWTYFFYFFRIFNLGFLNLLYHKSVRVEGTLWAQLLLEFLTDPLEIRGCTDCIDKINL